MYGFKKQGQKSRLKRLVKELNWAIKELQSDSMGKHDGRGPEKAACGICSKVKNMKSTRDFILEMIYDE